MTIFQIVREKKATYHIILNDTSYLNEIWAVIQTTRHYIVVNYFQHLCMSSDMRSFMFIHRNYALKRLL